MYIDKDKLIWWIDIEGLDCSGKETFAKMLRVVAEDFFKTKNDKVKVHLLSFPDYNIESGKEIKEMLQKDIKHRDNEKLSKLFAKNRKDVLDNISWSSHNIVIFDRFAMSNIIYGMLPIMEQSGFVRTYDTDIKFYELCKSVEQEFKDCRIGAVDELIMFSYFGSKSSEKHHETMLAKKQDTDANEDVTTQKYLSLIIDTYINNKVIEDIWSVQDDNAMVPLVDFCVSDMVKVKVGHTFSQSKCIKIINDILHHMDTVISTLK